MASMRELFPMHDYRKKPEKNFIKENIQKVKGCEQCFLEKKLMKLNSVQEKYKARQPAKRITELRPKAPSIKCNVKIIRHGNSSSCKGTTTTAAIDAKKSNVREREKNLITQGCQTEAAGLDSDEEVVSCQNCGQSMVSKRTEVPAPPVNERNQVQQQQQTSDKDKEEGPAGKKENQTKKDCSAKKSLDLASYKMGIVPRYLKERNAKLEQELKEKREREKIAEQLGLNDPKCPPGHMLMQKGELRMHLDNLEKKYNELIKQLNMMPVSSDSYRIKQRKIQIEKDLDDLESKIEVYKTGKVFVRIPELSTNT